MVVEAEVFDSVTEERLVAVIDSRGADKENPASWEELEQVMELYGRLVMCRFDNAKLPSTGHSRRMR